MRITVWDLETSGINLKANSGFVLCGGFMDVKTGKVEILKRDNIRQDPLNDKKLVKQIYDRLLEADIWVTHNGTWFDIPYLQSRLLKWGLPPLPNNPHFDTCTLSYKKLRIRNSLKEVGKFLGIKTKKHELDMDVWVRAYAGDKPSLSEIVRHCMQDVKLTEKVYLRLRPVGFKHPNVALISGNNLACPICGTRNSLRRTDKPHSAQVTSATRYQCKRCGGWCHGAYHRQGVEGRV